MQSATPSTRSSLILDQAVTVSSLDNHGKSMPTALWHLGTATKRQAFAIKLVPCGSPPTEESTNQLPPIKNGPEDRAPGPFRRKKAIALDIQQLCVNSLNYLAGKFANNWNGIFTFRGNNLHDSGTDNGAIALCRHGCRLLGIGDAEPDGDGGYR